MRNRPSVLLLIVALVALAITGNSSSCDRSPRRDPSIAKVQFTVAVPFDTDEKDTVYLSGNTEQLGNWNGKGLALQRQPNGDYAATLDVPKGTKLEYKATLGSWNRVEKGPGGTEIANRTLMVDGDKVEHISVLRWRDPKNVLPQHPTIVGEVRYHRDFRSPSLGNTRNLIVWLPAGYEAEPDRRYPVLYMHDGQNLFDASTSFGGEWCADETATRLIQEKRIEPIIIVGIENGGPARVDEYTPTRMATTRTGTTVEEGGFGERYAKFLIGEVKPFIDRTYRTQPDREHTAVAGSSLGGLISLYLGWQHGDTFGKCGCISPSLWWDTWKMLLAFEADNGWMKREKLWVDMGTAEGTGTQPDKNLIAARELHSIMQRAGLREGIDYHYAEFEGAEHNEKAWSERFDQVLLFFFGVH